MRALIVCLAIVVAVGVAHAGPTQDLDKGRQSFRAHDWQSTITTINFLLYPDLQLGRQDEVVEAHILLGASFFETGNRDKAIDEFRKALQLDPERSITNVNFSEGAVRLFDDTKAELRIRLEQEAERRRLAEAAQRLEEYRKSLVVYETHPYYVNFVPLGAGQFQNRQPTKGFLLFGSQIATGGTSLGMFLYLATKYGLQAKVPLEDGPRVRLLQQVEIGTGLAFFGLYAYGVVDSLLNYKPRAQIKGDDSLIPPDLLDPSKSPTKPAQKTSFRDRLKIAPMVTPNAFGIGIGWETD
ncbi:MAG TPA: tetratricopeptide repeat protein [Kofleriaceae bacterium]|nr:tetratricopeptide repeat protein [Kofleriaceae bacterium]